MTATGLPAGGAEFENGAKMNDINALEARIAMAFVRLKEAIDKAGPAATVPEPEEIDASETPEALKAQLEDERTVNAQLEERVRALKKRQDQKLATLEERVSAQKAQIAELDVHIQRVQTANAELREVATEMRTALIDETADPGLVNRAMLAELEALRATQSADRAEVDAILGELTATLEEV